jgi:PKD repeat protein
MTDSLIAPRTFKFRAFAIHNPNDPVVSYRWNFGDGSTANGQEVTHNYNAGGEYRVCLNIVTRSGCETRICNTVRVPGPNQQILQLTPNPVVNVLHALFLSTHNEPVNIKIVNANGVIVRSYTRYATIGVNNWDFDVASLLPGTYLFTLQSTNQLASAIFLKQ